MSNGDDPISLILAALVTIEQGLTPPAAASKQPMVYPEIPVNPGTFPCFLNAPSRGNRLTATAGTRERSETIHIMLLFGEALETYSERAAYLWVPVILDAFDSAVKLDTNVVQIAEITEWSYDPVKINEVEYIAVTFVLECQLAGAYTFGS